MSQSSKNPAVKKETSSISLKCATAGPPCAFTPCSRGSNAAISLTSIEILLHSNQITCCVVQHISVVHEIVLSPFQQEFKLFGISKMSQWSFLASLPTRSKPFISFHRSGRRILKLSGSIKLFFLFLALLLGGLHTNVY